MKKKSAIFSHLKKIAATCVILVILVCALPAGASASEAMPAEIRTVTFVADGEIFATVRLQQGDSLGNMPKVPAKEGYTGQWSRTVDIVSEDATITAIYTPVAAHSARNDLRNALMLIIPTVLLSVVVVLLTVRRHEQ